MEFKFTFADKEYILNEDNLDYFVNDEENPIKDIDEKKIIEILHNSENVELMEKINEIIADMDPNLYQSWYDEAAQKAIELGQI